MSCDNYIELMSAALDGELTAEERRELDRHLAACPACAALFEELSGQSAALRSLDCDLPDGLRERILAGLPARDPPTKKGRVIHWKRWASLAACLLLVAVVGSFFPGQMGSSASNGAASGSSAADQAPMAVGEPAPAAVSQSPAQYYDLPTEDGVPSVRTAEYTWSMAQYLRVDYGSTPAAPSAVVLASADSLAGYLAQFGPTSELASLPEAYPEDFFADRCLLAIVLEESSGSVSHEVEALTADEVVIRRVVPEEGTCDMAAWLILLELDAVLNDGAALNVVFSN